MFCFQYPEIDMEQTGKRLKAECERQKYTVKDLQKYLKIGAYQSIYAWFEGKTLPTLDNMYALSVLLGKTVNELIVSTNEISRQKYKFDEFNHFMIRRMRAYFCLAIGR